MATWRFRRGLWAWLHLAYPPLSEQGGYVVVVGRGAWPQGHLDVWRQAERAAELLARRHRLPRHHLKSFALHTFL